jgi:hypothetical protein
MDWTLTLLGSGDGDAAQQAAAQFIGELEAAGQTINGGNFSTQSTIEDVTGRTSQPVAGVTA